MMWEFTRELDKESLLNYHPIYTTTSGPCYNLMSASFPTQGHHVVYMCPDVIFQILLPPSRPYDVTSCDMSCDCEVSCLFIVQTKKKKKTKFL